MEPDMTGDEAVRAWRRHWAELRRADRDAIPDLLGPPEAFDDRHATDAERRRCGMTVSPNETGPRSRTVETVLRVCSAGRKHIPRPEDFHRAIHAPLGTAKETGILLTWYHEAHLSDVVNARLEGACSRRELVRALHRVGLKHGSGARRLNWFAR